MTPTPESAGPGLRGTCSEVFFDGSCPLCSREIAMYRRQSARTELTWIDVSAPDYRPPAGVTQATLMQRFHVTTREGVLLSGAGAFVYLWSQLPGWHHLANLAKVPGVLLVMAVGYRVFLVFRPLMQSLYRFWHKQSSHSTHF